MGDLLSPERVAEIRAAAQALHRRMSPSDATVLALCDTVETLRAEAAQSLAGALCQIEDQQAELETVTAERDELAKVIAYEGVRELETLRGIVARIRDDWKPYEQANGSTPRWVRAGDAGQIEDDLLTPAEVEAIYGKEKKDSDE